MAYREAPPAAGLPFPRKLLAIYSALAIVVAVLVLVLPLPFFASPAGWRMFTEGGSRMYALLLASFLVAGIQGAMGALAVRGKRSAAAVLAGVPAILVVIGAMFAALGLRMATGAVEGESVDPGQAMRILAEGIAESNVLYIIGCTVGGVAFGAAAVGLLGAAASVDRRRVGAPLGGGWLAPLLIGIVAVIGALGTRVALRTFLGPSLLVIPSLVVLTVVATIAARNAKLASAWHDSREANSWLAAVLAAAIAAAAGIALFDVAASFFAERAGLGAIAGESVDLSQKARILAELLSERRAALICACVDGALAFMTVASGLLNAFGRGPDGSKRSPLGPPVFLALAGVVVMSAAILGVRAWTFRAIDRAALKGQQQRNFGAQVVLPSAPTTQRLPPGEGYGTVLTVHADGSFASDGDFRDARNVLLVADQRARWSDVANALRTKLAEAHSHHDGAAPPLPTVAIGVKPQTTSGPLLTERLGAYAVFVPPEEPSIAVALEPQPESGFERRRTVRVDDLPPTAEMDVVLQRIADRVAATNTSSGRSVPVIVLGSPTGSW